MGPDIRSPTRHCFAGAMRPLQTTRGNLTTYRKASNQQRRQKLRPSVAQTTRNLYTANTLPFPIAELVGATPAEHYDLLRLRLGLAARFFRLGEHFLRLDDRFFRLEDRFLALGERFLGLCERFFGLGERFFGLGDAFLRLGERFRRLGDRFLELPLGDRFFLLADLFLLEGRVTLGECRGRGDGDGVLFLRGLGERLFRRLGERFFLLAERFRAGLRRLLLRDRPPAPPPLSPLMASASTARLLWRALLASSMRNERR